MIVPQKYCHHWVGRRQPAAARRVHQAENAVHTSSTTHLSSACTINQTHIGLNPDGFRGLLASKYILPGEVVLQLPLQNMLQVARNPAAATAATSALETYQQHHGQLPHQLLAFLTDHAVIWEAKLVAWLLHLRATAAVGSLWRAYINSLPSAADTLTFISYSEQHAEQLQFSTWKGLAHKQRQLLAAVQQQCSHLWDVSDVTSSSSMPSTADVAWALSMVKSRTFGQRLPASMQQQQQQPSQQQDRGLHKTSTAGVGPAADAADMGAAAMAEATPSPSLAVTPAAAGIGAAAAAATAAAAGAAAAAGTGGAAAAANELEGADEDDGAVVLLMAPYLDMINHAQQHNCYFAVNWKSQCFEVRCNAANGTSSNGSNGASNGGSSGSSSGGIAAGEEITISYGSNKSNLALLSCYGFQIPGNVNDAQLLAPVFSGCLAAAGGIAGFDSALLEGAAAKRRDSLQQQRQQQREHDGPPQQRQQQFGHTGALDLPACAYDGQQTVQRCQCAIAASPVRAETLHGESQQQQVQQQQQVAQQPVQQLPQQGSKQDLQLQRYLAQLILYQLQQMACLCGSSIEDDSTELRRLLDKQQQRVDRRQQAQGAVTIGNDGGSSCAAGREDFSSSGPSTSIDSVAVQRQVLEARIEQKLVLRECETLCTELLAVIEQKLVGV